MDWMRSKWPAIHIFKSCFDNQMRCVTNTSKTTEDSKWKKWFARFENTIYWYSTWLSRKTHDKKKCTIRHFYFSAFRFLRANTRWIIWFWFHDNSILIDFSLFLIKEQFAKWRKCQLFHFKHIHIQLDVIVKLIIVAWNFWVNKQSKTYTINIVNIVRRSPAVVSAT